MYRAKEVLEFLYPFRLGVASLLLVHSDPASIAECTGAGVKFFTNFSDRSLLISSTLHSDVAFQDQHVQPLLRIVRTRPRETVEDAWLCHKRQIAEMEAQGNAIRQTSTFIHYVEISGREELDLILRKA